MVKHCLCCPIAMQLLSLASQTGAAGPELLACLHALCKAQKRITPPELSSMCCCSPASAYRRQQGRQRHDDLVPGRCAYRLLQCTHAFACEPS